MRASAPAPKVLVIDDSATVCLFMASALEKAGYQVIIATDGREGLMKALQERPDCLVLAVVNPPSPPREEPSLTLNKLIPHRSEDANLMSSSNPLSRSVVISDKQARRLYAAIDGQKNVEELCMVIHLDVKQAPKVLQLLLDQQLIHLYGPGRRLTE